MKKFTLLAVYRIVFMLVFAGICGNASAQNPKEIYNSTIDQINCATIQFIHREQGRAEVANNMNCLSYEAILKSVPNDEAGSTGALCKKINEYKSKYKEDKPLDAQLDEVIKFADSKITAKKRKNNVEDFKAKLETLKKEAIDNAGAGGKKPENKPSAPAENNTAQSNAANGADTGNAITETGSGDNTVPAKSKKTDWLGLLSLLVGLGALGLAYLAYSKVKNQENTGSANAMGYGNKANNKEATETSLREINRIENKFNSEIAALNRKIDELSALASSSRPSPSIGYSETVHKTEIPQDNAIMESAYNNDDSEPEPWIQPEPEPVADIPAPSVVEIVPEPELNSGTEVKEPIVPTSNIESAPSDAPAIPENTPSAPDLFAAGTVKNQQEVQENIIPAAADENVAQNIAEEPFMPVKEYEDGEAVPFYMYVGLPDVNGNFALNSFTSDPVKDSVYEIEMYEDVPDKAFFSLLPNPDIIRKALLEPEIYLSPCCTFTDNPEGKRTIILVEEGMLRKQDDKWMIYEKAKINFE